MRLIDADEEIKWANENLPDAHAGVITSFLRDCPTIDAVEVVRCRECIYWTGVALGMRCKLYSFPPNVWICSKPDDFCSKGQREEDKHEVSEP